MQTTRWEEWGRGLLNRIERKEPPPVGQTTPPQRHHPNVLTSTATPKRHPLTAPDKAIMGVPPSSVVAKPQKLLRACFKSVA